MNSKFNLFALTGAAIAAFVFVCVWLNQGYGKVSPKAYEFSTAIYSACLKKSDVHVTKVEEMLQQADAETLPEKQRKWLQKMVDEAKNGQWESAAQKAKRMMNDQVEY